MELRDNWNKIKDNQERDALVMQIFMNTITKEDRRYQVSWSWRTQNHNLSEKYELSLGKLKTLMKRCEKDHDLLQRYKEIIKDQLSKGVIEKVEEKNGNRKHYIPLHAVTTTEKSTNKVRVVHDASAKTNKQKILRALRLESTSEIFPRDNNFCETRKYFPTVEKNFRRAGKI